MNKFNADAIKNCAKSAITRHRELWQYVSDEVRDALVDSTIMDQIRIADSADSGATFSAHEIVEFRCKVAEALATGVMVGSTKRGLTFDRDR